MWERQGHHQMEKKRSGMVAVAIDSDKGSQYALKWAIDNLLSIGKTVVLIHVRVHHPGASHDRKQLEKQTKDLFLTFHCYCTRKDIHSFDVTLDDLDVVRAITDYVSYAAIEYLVLGASSRHGFIRFKSSHISSNISKGAPDFCTVYVISKGKVSSVRNASRPAPNASPLIDKIEDMQRHSPGHDKPLLQSLGGRKSRTPLSIDADSLKSVLARGGGSVGYFLEDLSETDTDISWRLLKGLPTSAATSKGAGKATSQAASTNALTVPPVKASVLIEEGSSSQLLPHIQELQCHVVVHGEDIRVLQQLVTDAIRSIECLEKLLKDNLEAPATDAE